tara:strand:- start:1361 stop:1684 length:324 start_codon:yes stop_codon:yes gene_type:complete
MTTNEIEKQLKERAEYQIRDHAKMLASTIEQFAKEHTNVNSSGMQWFSKRVKPHKKYTSDPEPEDPWNHYNWNELAQLIRRNMEYNLLDLMVEKKAKELLSKMDLFE